MDRMETESVLCDVRYARQQLMRAPQFVEMYDELRRCRDALTRAEELLESCLAAEAV